MTTLLANRITTLVRAPPMAAAASAASSAAVSVAGGRRPLLHRTFARPPPPEAEEEQKQQAEEDHHHHQQQKRACRSRGFSSPSSSTSASCSASSSSSSSSSSAAPPPTPARGMVVIVGATGTGKTKLSIDAAEALNGEVVNADKIQLYAGLDITTNKVSATDRRGVPHHLLGAVLPDAGEFPPSTFRSVAAATAASIAARRRVPVVAGGSNSLIHALLADRFDASATADPFSSSASSSTRSHHHYRPALRSPCCLLWVHVDDALLAEYLDRRVDDMVGGGMVEELREYFATTTAAERAAHAAGLGKAIGVPELGAYFAGRTSFRAAVEEIKANTRDLAAAQVRKIRRMADAWGWPVQRLDATATVEARLRGAGPDAESACWERDVREPGLAAIRSFLLLRGGDGGDGDGDGDSTTVVVNGAAETAEEPTRVRCCDVVG